MVTPRKDPPRKAAAAKKAPAKKVTATPKQLNDAIQGAFKVLHTKAYDADLCEEYREAITELQGQFPILNIPSPENGYHTVFSVDIKGIKGSYDDVVNDVDQLQKYITTAIDDCLRQYWNDRYELDQINHDEIYD